MKKRSSHKLIWSEFGALITLLALATFWVPTPHSTAQQDNRQLNREQTQQAKRASERRIALVIGNGAYTNAPPLKNPSNDARDMAATLKDLGFEVASGINISQREMKSLIRDFGQKLKTGGAGLFYYAGHGVQAKGRNYLIPVEADIQSEAEVEDAGVDVNLVLNYMDDAQNSLNIVILDACRNNPFGRSFRSASSGLAQIDAPTGTLIAYATAPGRVASDGTGQNGLYTSELLKQMRVPGLSVIDMFMRVRADVIRQTGGKQVPWEASSLVGSLYLGPPKNNQAGAVNEKTEPSAFELTYWETIKSSNNPEDFKAYINEYPNGRFVALAKNRISSLETPAKPTETRSASDTSAATELAFWDSIKNSNDLEDFKDYLSKYPSGQFAGLARRRVAVLVPNPQLAFAGQENFQSDGKNWTRYELNVTNRATYPDELFAASPNLPPCGKNTKSARTWVDIYDGTGKRLYGFCALGSADNLNKIWFGLPQGQAAPSHVYIVLTDRLTNLTHKSNLLAIP